MPNDRTELDDRDRRITAARLLRSSRLFRLAEEGAVKPETVSAYLFNIRYLIRHTPTYLELARRESEARGQLDLAGYYAVKAAEEHGHDVWADNDLASVTRSHQVVPPCDPSPAIAELVHYLRYVITADPQRYLGYILLAEYFTVLVGPAWLNALDESCGISPSSLTAIGHHVELDREHVSEGLSQIDESDRRRGSYRVSRKRYCVRCTTSSDSVTRLALSTTESAGSRPNRTVAERAARLPIRCLAIGLYRFSSPKS